MNLKARLENLKTPNDLKALFVDELNFGPLSDQLMGMLTLTLRAQIDSARAIAGQGEFKVVHCVLKRLLKTLERQVSEQFAKIQETGNSLIVFTDPEFKEWHFTSLRPVDKALKIRPFRRLVVGKDERLRTADERLSLLKLEGSESALEVQKKCDEAFDVEAVSRTFYQDFVRHYKEFRQTIMDENQLRQEDADEFTQTVFNRFFFLYFVQKKGYLNGDAKFIYHNYQKIGKKNFYQTFLLPLFQKLSKPDFRHEGFEKIPFLNGGLFEFRDDEKKKSVPNGIFDGLFQGLFEHYNFTVCEDTEFDKEVAIDPEMMGTIFENLILSLESKEFKDIPDPRRATGSYYTRKFIVAFMVKQALLNDLVTHVKGAPRSHLHKLVFHLKTEAVSHETLKQVKDRLKIVKIVDPAVGSGAYAVGALLKIVEIIEAIDRALAPEICDRQNYRYNLKRYAIENNIYGVDIQQKAVGLANLRLWLSLIVDLEVKNIRDIPPLPNLDFHILCGDSLVSKVAGYSYDMERIMEPSQREADLIDKFKDLKEKHHGLPTLKQKEESRKKIEAIKTEILTWFLKEIQKKKNRELSGIEGEQSLFDDDEVMAQKKLDLTGPVKSEIAEIDKILSKKEKLANIFNWGLDFFDVIVLNGGFDIVIANPPYGVKVEDALRVQFGVQNKDSYGVFTILGLRILKPEGTLCYIMSDTWQTIRTHKPLREILLRETNVQHLIFLPPDVFQATVNTGVYTLIKRRQKRSRYNEDADNWILAADFSSLKIRRGGKTDSTDLEEAFDKLMDVEDFQDQEDGYTIWSDRKSALFAYQQKLISIFTNFSFFISYPKLYNLMKDIGNIENDLSEKLNTLFNLHHNDNTLKAVKLGSIAEIRQGLATGDNEYYLRQSKETIQGSHKNYKIVDNNLVLKDIEIKKISSNEKLCKEIINKGISLNSNSPRYFGGKYFVPYDKGSASDIEEGWLPNYYVPIEYYIDWSEKAVKRLKTLTINKRDKTDSNRNDNSKICSRFQNSDCYFKKYLTFSRTGIYAPTFRIGYNCIFDTKSDALITDQINLAILNSKLIRYLYKSYLCHTVQAEGDALEMILIPIKLLDLKRELDILEKSIISKQKQNERYNYLINEQIQIDGIIYNFYNLNNEDILEVDNWYQRRYPKLTSAIERKSEEKAVEQQ